MEHQLLKRLEASLRLVGAQGRETVRTGPFELFVSASENPYLNFATPHADVPDWSGAVRALGEVFAERGRQARLEYLHELHPSLAPALEAAGFRRESAAPVMTLTPDAMAGPPPLSYGTYRRLRTDEPGALRRFLEGQNKAYGELGEGGALAWLPHLTEGLRSGAVLGAGLWQDGDVVSGATIQTGGPPPTGVGELAGVWTRLDRQKRGLAFAVCQRLLEDHFAAGRELCWLSAAEGAEGLYERLGFGRVGTQLNYSLAGGGR